MFSSALAARDLPSSMSRSASAGSRAISSTTGTADCRPQRTSSAPCSDSLPGGAVRSRDRGHALRNLHVRDELAESPVAMAAAPPRSEAARGCGRARVRRDRNERLLERVLVRGYIMPATSHEQAAYELNLSRSRTSAGSASPPSAWPSTCRGTEVRPRRDRFANGSRRRRRERDRGGFPTKEITRMRLATRPIMLRPPPRCACWPPCRGSGTAYEGLYFTHLSRRPRRIRSA